LLSQSRLLREPWKYLPNGTQVLVETGPLAGVRGIIISGGNTRQLIISVTLLQRSVAIQLDENTMISVISAPEEARVKFRNESYLAINLLRNKPSTEIRKSK